jgi:hypothetical protein
MLSRSGEAVENAKLQDAEVTDRQPDLLYAPVFAFYSYLHRSPSFRLAITETPTAAL